MNVVMVWMRAMLYDTIESQIHLCDLQERTKHLLTEDQFMESITTVAAYPLTVSIIACILSSLRGAKTLFFCTAESLHKFIAIICSQEEDCLSQFDTEDDEPTWSGRYLIQS